MPDTPLHTELHTDDARTATVPDASAGRRFDAVLAELFPQFSRSRLTTWIKAGEVLLDGVVQAIARFGFHQAGVGGVHQCTEIAGADT